MFLMSKFVKIVVFYVEILVLISTFLYLRSKWVKNPGLMIKYWFLSQNLSTKWNKTLYMIGWRQEYRFYLREKLSDSDCGWPETLNGDPQLIRDYFRTYLYPPRDREYPDLCQLPDLNEETLMDNLRARFQAGHIYTYVGSILIAVNPFKFYPIYNPKYVKLYQNKRLGELSPHIFAIADAAYNAMMRDRKPQCIVISGQYSSSNTIILHSILFIAFLYSTLAKFMNNVLLPTDLLLKTENSKAFIYLRVGAIIFLKNELCTEMNQACEYHFFVFLQ